MLPLQYKDTVFQTEAWALLSVGLFIVILRTTSRVIHVGVRNFWADDYLMLFAALLFIIEVTMDHIINGYGGTNNMPSSMRAALTPHQILYLTEGAKWLFAAWFVYVGMIWVLKACMIGFYFRLTLGLRQQKLLKIVAVVTALSYLVVIFTLCFTCRPIRGYWQVVPDPGALCSEGWWLYGVSGFFNILTDILLIMVPFPILLKIQMPLRQKLPLYALFSLGGFVIIATITRTIVIYKNIYAVQQSTGWAVRETFVSLIVGNAPMIKPLFDLFRRKLGWQGSNGTSNGSHIQLSQHANSQGHTKRGLSLSRKHISSSEEELRGQVERTLGETRFEIQKGVQINVTRTDSDEELGNSQVLSGAAVTSGVTSGGRTQQW